MVKENSKVRSPSQCFDWVLAQFGRERRLALCGTFVIGVLIHFSLLAHQVTNPDGIWNSVFKLGSTWETQLGRWGLHFVQVARHGLVLPVISVLISLLMISLVALLVRELLGLQSSLHILLMAGLLVSYPFVASTMNYFYCADAYFLSLFFSVFGVFLTARGKRWISILTGAACLIAGMALYQSYIGISIALCFSVVLLDLLNEKLPLANVFRRAGRLVVMGVLGAAGYFVSMKLALRVTGLVAASYRGIDHIGQSKPDQLPGYFTRSIYEFFAFYLKDDFLKNSWWGLKGVYGILMLIILVVSLLLLYQKRLWKSPLRMALLLFCVPLFPVAHEAIVFLAPETKAGILMLPQMVLPFILLLAFCEQLQINWKAVVLQWGAAVMCLVLCFQYALLTNTMYLRMDLDAQRSEASAIQVLAMLQQHPNYKPDRKIAVLGNPLANEYSPRAYPEVALAVLGTTARWGVVPWKLAEGSQAAWSRFLQLRCGIELHRCTTDEIVAIQGSHEFKAMPSFPAKGCVQEISGILTVKFSDFD
jgi:hypothetical protein